MAQNRREVTDKGIKLGNNPGGPVDQSLPLLRVSGDDGGVRAVVVNYACHCTTLGGNFKKLCGDWAGYACEAIESEFRGHGDGHDRLRRHANPRTRGTLQNAKDNGEAIALEAERLARSELTALSPAIEARLKRIELPFGPLPTRAEWEGHAKPGALGFHARTNLARLEQGQALPTVLP